MRPGGPDRAAERARRAALRLAFGVAACFAVVEALDWDVTFLAPLLAANILVKLERPPPSLAQGLAFLGLIAVSTGIVMVLTAAFIGSPVVLILALALIIYLSFYAHRRGAPELVTLLPQISAVMLPTIAILSPAAAGSFATTIVLAGIVALITVWTAHTIFPAPAAAGPEASPANDTARAAGPTTAARHALYDTLILLPVLSWFILDATQVAIVVLIVIVTLLRQHDRGQGQQTALGLILGNLIGGIAAAGFYNLMLVGGSLLFFVMACFAASLIFAGRIVVAAERAPIYAIAFATFILLLGLGMSPLPGTSGEAFFSRLLNVLLASAYAIGGLSLVERWRRLPS
ncbi:DUF2955 domain-containing protein [Rhizobium favelukesii]|uniref:Transmembrane protein n=1 Tax=Rhizobium favelukesii TaxID=348824 RepID=W6RTE1_9HYPH|nr:DUF2955 domain-containing protein [Rhizobium favelukesii]CDM62028.1 hypothetical protein LPU83_pLPU83d_0657 [Rhizobium favelukesii]